MKKIASLALLIVCVATVWCSEAENQMRAIAKRCDACLCDRFSNWVEKPSVDRWTVTLCFVIESPLGDAISAHPGGMPYDKLGFAEVQRRCDAVTRRVEFGAAKPNQIMRDMGFSGYFDADSSDARPAVFDGHGLVGERLYRDE